MLVDGDDDKGGRPVLQGPQPGQGAHTGHGAAPARFRTPDLFEAAHVLVEPEDSGLPDPSVVNVSQLISADKSLLDDEPLVLQPHMQVDATPVMATSGSGLMFSAPRGPGQHEVWWWE